MHDRPNSFSARPTALAWGLLAAVGSAAAPAQLRVADWNVSNYSSGRITEFQTSIYGVFQGRSMSPDLLIAQEFLSASAVTAFLSILNTAPGSPADWAAAPFTNGNDSDNAFFYRTNKVQFLAMTIVSTGGSGLSNHPRDVARYDIRPVGYTGAGATLACYSSHMKAGSSSDDQAQRLIEANNIRANSGTLNLAWNYLLAGDFNIQTSSQAAYGALIAMTTGRFVDPIKTPGSWNNNSSYRFVHTQSPGGSDPNVTGGMDDRLDFIMPSPSLLDGVGFDYIGNPNIAYSTSTWNDPNHSFRCWGNDGSSFDEILTITGNTMVGTAIAQALHDSPGNEGGHLPVFMDLRVPPEVASVPSINFGQVVQNSSQQRTLNVSNGGDVAKWTAAGIATLTYSLSATSGYTAPAGTFNALPAAAGNNHSISMNTSVLGTLNGTVTINSNSPDEPARIVNIAGQVIAPTCYANCDGIGGLTGNDFQCFLDAYVAGQTYADCDGVGGLTANDFQCFLNAFVAGCS